MKRRQFLKFASMAGASTILPFSPLSLWGMAPSFGGDFLLYIQAGGGWDVTSFCDPKVNVTGEDVINNWADTAEVQMAGNLRYAPVADNATFFTDHYDKMLVINGVNARTNAHGAGTQHNHTGSQRKGTPHLAALYAYEKGPGMVMPVMAGSDFISGGLMPPTALGRRAFELINPNLWSLNNVNYTYLPADDLQSIRALRQHQAESLNVRTHLLPKQRKQIEDYYKATIADTRGFEHFQDVYHGLDQGKYPMNRHTESLKIALTAFQAGLGIAADISIKGFDSHENHDAEFAERMRVLTDAVGCAWNYAEQLGIANRLVVVMSSDFGRTPRYNDEGGKDHWPYGSTVIMKKNVSWTNRMLGYTDGGHTGQPINPQTLQVDKLNGVEIEPKHVMQALRRLLGVADSTAAARFGLGVDREFNFFA